MTYPNSSAVVAGQATEADQYNFLRNDALCLGGDPANSGTLLDLLYQKSGEIRLSRASKTTIRLEADADNPCALMIGGSICTRRSDEVLTLSADSFPDPGRYSLYAAGTSDGSFSLRAGNGSVPSGGREVGTFVWSGCGVIPGTVHDLKSWNRLQEQNHASVVQGRLTLVPGEPVSDSDITHAETLYFTPYHGNSVSLYQDGYWEPFTFSELSLSLSGLQRGIPYDVFLSADEDGLRLSTLSWGTSAARPSGMLVRQDGVRVMGGSSGKRFLGSFVLNSSGYAEDSTSGRLLWNENHRLPRPIISKLVTTKAQGTNHVNSWAPYYDEDAPSVRVLLPVPDAEFSLTGVGLSSPISESDRSYLRASALGICRDMMTVSPYTGNENCAEVFTHSCGNAPLSVQVQNHNASNLGYHRFTLAFWSNYNFYPTGTSLSSSVGECPGLYGVIQG